MQINNTKFSDGVRWMDALYYFVLSAVIATFGIGWAVRSAIKDLSGGLERRESVQTKMFIKVAAVEAIPIILIVLGFINLADSTADALLPLVIVGAVTFLNIFMIYRTSADITSDRNISTDLKTALTTLSFIGIMLVSTIPIVAVVASLMVIE